MAASSAATVLDAERYPTRRNLAPSPYQLCQALVTNSVKPIRPPQLAFPIEMDSLPIPSCPPAYTAYNPNQHTNIESLIGNLRHPGFISVEAQAGMITSRTRRGGGEEGLSFSKSSCRVVGGDSMVCEMEETAVGGSGEEIALLAAERRKPCWRRRREMREDALRRRERGAEERVGAMRRRERVSPASDGTRDRPDGESEAGCGLLAVL